MSNQFELVARERTQSGTTLVRRLRREGDVPAIIYGGNKENALITINYDVLFHSLEKKEFQSAIISINTDGKKEQAILREVQRHPHKTSILHADFQRIDATKVLTMSLPIDFIGEDVCVGTKAGGIISRLINEVEVSCLPKDLPESIELDVTELNLNESLHLSDIKLGDGVNLTALLHDTPQERDYAVITVLPLKVEAVPSEEAVDSDSTAAVDNYN